MSKQFAIDLTLNGHDNGAGAAVEGLGQKLKLMHKEAAASGELNIERMLRSPEKLLGGLGQLGGIGGAGLALAGIHLLAGGLEEMGNKVREVRKNWDSFDPSEKAFQVATVIPVVGDIARAIHGIVGLWSDQESAEERANRELEVHRVHLERIKELDSEIGKITEENNRLLRETGQAQEHALRAPGRAGTPEDAAAERLADQVADHQDAINKKRKELEEQSVELQFGHDTRAQNKNKEALQDLAQEQVNLYAWRDAKLKEIDQQAAQRRHDDTIKEMEEGREKSFKLADQQERIDREEREAQSAAERAQREQDEKQERESREKLVDELRDKREQIGGESAGRDPFHALLLGQNFRGLAEGQRDHAQEMVREQREANRHLDRLIQLVEKNGAGAISNADAAFFNLAVGGGS